MGKKIVFAIGILLLLLLAGCINLDQQKASHGNPLLGKWKLEKVISIDEKTAAMTEMPIPETEQPLIMEYKVDEVCSTGLPGVEGTMCKKYTIEGNVIHVWQADIDEPAMWKMSGEKLTVTPRAQKGRPAFMLVFSKVQ